MAPIAINSAAHQRNCWPRVPQLSAPANRCRLQTPLDLPLFGWFGAENRVERLRICDRDLALLTMPFLDPVLGHSQPYPYPSSISGLMSPTRPNSEFSESCRVQTQWTAGRRCRAGPLLLTTRDANMVKCPRVRHRSRAANGHIMVVAFVRMTRLVFYAFFKRPFLISAACCLRFSQCCLYRLLFDA